MSTQTQSLSLKAEKLQEVADALKQRFVGVDEVIDSFIHQIRPWYLTPSLLERPIIINLWGMTGVGKTDLVRQFAKLLDFQDRFLEIELSNSHRSAYFEYDTNIANILQRNHLFDKNPSILFFDEFQHFRSIDQDGKEISERRFQDFWELLSDGKLSRRDVASNLEEMMMEMLYDEARAKSNKQPVDQVILQSPWIVKRLRNILRDTSNEDLSLESLISMPSEKILQLLESSRKSKKIFETVELHQALIIIGGNLDSLYTMAGLTSEAEVDANIFHDQTKKLSVIDVKKALEERFRPEQISRLGNTHIIYPSLSRNSFKELIRTKLKEIEKKVKQEIGVDIIFDSSIDTLIYQNGVFPTQGVRPVFGAISEILITRIGEWTLKTIEKKQTKVKVSYSLTKNQFVITYPDKPEVADHQEFQANLDRIRNNKSKDEQAVVACHEAGHAVVYAVLFGLSPVQLKSRLASWDKSGFTFPHKIELSLEHLEYQLQVLVAGFIAEEMIYGKENVSAGHQSDIERATALASMAIRALNYGEIKGKIVSPHDPQASTYRTDIDASNRKIEELLTLSIDKCRRLLDKHKQFLSAVAEALLEQGVLEPSGFVQLAKDHNVKCEQQPESWVVIADYKNLLTQK